MENLIIEGDFSTPTVFFSENSVSKIECRGIPQDARQIFQLIYEWVENCQTEKLVLDVNLYYYNTAISKQLYDLFEKFEENSKIGEIYINWYYEEGDDGARQSGELYSELLERTNFRYIEYAET